MWLDELCDLDVSILTSGGRISTWEVKSETTKNSAHKPHLSGHDVLQYRLSRILVSCDVLSSIRIL